MNYGRQQIQKKKRSLTAEKLENKAGMTLIRLFLVAVLALTVLVTCTGYGIVHGLISSAPDITSLSTAPTEAATYIYAPDGRQLQKLNAATSNRIPVSLDKIPADLQHAVVAIEDERFYEHNGIDVRGIIRAFVVGITGGSFSEGASTITQQLLKNSVFTDWVNESTLLESFKRKLQEQYLAIQLEKNLEQAKSKTEVKDQILADYLNMINLGAGTYGVQAAAKRYFNKDVSELNLSECTVIAGITQNPTGYNPILYPESNARRRERVLSAMLEQGYISQAGYDEALADDVYSRIQETASVTEDTGIYTYYTDAMIDQILEDLVNKGYTSTQASRMLYSGGLKIYSVQDMEIQKICDEEFANPDNFPYETLIGLDYALSVQKASGETVHYGNDNVEDYFRTSDPSFRMMFSDEAGARTCAENFRKAHVNEGDTVLGERISLVPQPQASVVVIDQATGYIKAIVGGRGKKEASLTLNRATASRRQPGSTFKPLAVYGPALDYGNKTLASVYDNAPYSYSSGEELKNWDSDYGYSGMETIHTALMKSINVVAVKALTEITPQIGLNYLEMLGITTLYDNDTDINGSILTDAYQSLALGGVTDGVVNLELTAAYAALANHGKYIRPKFYSRVEDSQGNVILDNTCSESPVFSESTAWLITNAMKDVISNSLGTAYSYISLGDMPAAGKTGTTDAAKDIWFEGYTPYYTCGVWGGYDNNDALPDYDSSYSTYAKVLWNSIMNRIHAELPYRDFEQPAGITGAQICMKSGKLAVPGLCDCDQRGSQVMTEYFAEGTVPTAYCDAHVSVSVCSETGLRASKTCKPVQKVFLQRPAGSVEYTYDTPYAPPVEACTGHASTINIQGQEKTPETDANGNPVNGSDTQNPYNDPGLIYVVEPSDGQNWNQNSNQNGNQNSNQGWNQNSDQYWNQNSDQSWNQNSDQSWNQNSDQYWYENSEQYWYQNYDEYWYDDAMPGDGGYSYDTIPADSYYNNGYITFY